MKPIRDFAPGEIIFTTERIGDDRNTMEVREVFYLRDPDGPCRYPNNVRVAILGIAQGDPDNKAAMDWVPRYVRMLAKPCRDPGEIDGRVQAHALADGGSVWARFFRIEPEAA